MATKYLPLILMFVGVAIVTMPAQAGKVVVRKSSEPFDAFAVRDQVLREHAWQEALRMQQQINILQALPIGCLLVASPYRYYHCGGQYYRPYTHEQQQLFIQIDPPQQTELESSEPKSQPQTLPESKPISSNRAISSRSNN